MTGLLHAWLVGPLALLALAWGAGWLVARWTGPRPASGIVLASGIAALVVVGNALTTVAVLTRWTVPVCAAVALAGWAVWAFDRWADRPDSGPIWRPTLLAPFLLVVVTLLSGAAVIASGQATWAGWVMLDDGASFLGFTDWVMDHGRVLPTEITSTYQRLIDVNLGDNDLGHVDNYPTGLFVPLGVLSALVRLDGAWLLQPVMATVAGALGLVLVAALRPAFSTWGIGIRRSAWLAGGAATIAALATTYLAYAQWGALKEVVFAPLVGLVAVCGSQAAAVDLTPDARLRTLVPGLVGIASLMAIGSWSSLGHVLPLVVATGLLILVRLRPLAGRVAAIAVGSAAAAYALLVVMGLDPIGPRLVPAIPDIGNLFRPLSPWQVVGIWPSGDFRIDPVWPAATAVLIAIAVVAAAVGFIALMRSGEWALPLWAGTALVVAAYAHILGGAWLAGKAIAVASPAVIALALAGCAAVAFGSRRREHGVARKALAFAAASAVVVGVLWSDALGYAHVWLAPSVQQSELEEIGRDFAGQGPALMLEYAPYAARHFLRDLDAESASELRVHTIPQRDGSELAKGTAADIGAFAPDVIGDYPLLVLRRDVAASRPPSAYEVAWAGDYYDVWRRVPARALAVDDLPLGTAGQPVSIPNCTDVMRLAAAAPSGRLVAARRAPVTVLPNGSGMLTVPTDGDYRLWLAGSWPGELTVTVDGVDVHSSHSVIEGNPALSNPVGSVWLDAGDHAVTVTKDRSWWLPGSSAGPFTFGPLYASTGNAADAELVIAPTGSASNLCGKAWDWIEVHP